MSRFPQGHGFASGNNKKGLWIAGGIGGLGITVVLLSLLLPGLVYLSFFILGSTVNSVVGEENMPYYSKNREGVTKSVEQFTPQPTWTQISKTDVHKPSACSDKDRLAKQENCEMFKGVWNTHTAHNEDSIIEIAKSFGGISKYDTRTDLIKSECVRPSPEAPLGPCTTTTYVETGNYNSFAFTLSLTDEGPGTDVIATVTYNR